MSLTGLMYDESAYNQLLRESLGTLKYQLNYPQSAQCFVDDPNIIMQKSGVSVDAIKPMIDVDSELMGLTRKLSKDPKEKFIPKLDKDGNICNETPFPREKIDFKVCNNIKTEHTRLSNPSYNLRGTGWNRWEWLCTDPQKNLDIPFSIDTDTKILEKDKHRPHLVKPLDPIESLPKEKNEKKKTEKYVFDEVPTEPKSVNWELEKQELNTNYSDWLPKDVLNKEVEVPTGPTSIQWQNFKTLDGY